MMILINGIVVSGIKFLERNVLSNIKMVGRYAEDDYLMSKVFSNDDCRIVVIKRKYFITIAKMMIRDDKKEDNINKLFLDVLKGKRIIV